MDSATLVGYTHTMGEEKQAKTLGFNASRTEGAAIVALLGLGREDDQHADAWARAMRTYLEETGWPIKAWGHWDAPHLVLVK